jgi:hypothetical protein
MFLFDHRNVKIGKSKLAEELKPPNVFHQSETPKDACLCQYHKNINLLCHALHKVCPVCTLALLLITWFACRIQINV